MIADDVLRTHHDTDVLIDAASVDTALQNLLKSFNDIVENKQIVCSVNPNKLSDDTTIGQLKQEMAKLDTPDQLELLSTYVKERKQMGNPHESEDQDDKRLKWWVTKKLINFAGRLFTIFSWVMLIFAITLAYGYIKNGTLEKDVIFKILDTIVDVLKFFIGSANK